MALQGAAVTRLSLLPSQIAKQASGQTPPLSVFSSARRAGTLSCSVPKKELPGDGGQENQAIGDDKDRVSDQHAIANESAGRTNLSEEQPGRNTLNGICGPLLMHLSRERRE